MPFLAVQTLKRFPEGSTAMVSRCLGPSFCWPASSCSFWHLIGLILLAHSPFHSQYIFGDHFYEASLWLLWDCPLFHALILSSWCLPEISNSYLFCSTSLWFSSSVLYLWYPLSTRPRCLVWNCQMKGQKIMLRSSCGESWNPY